MNDSQIQNQVVNTQKTNHITAHTLLYLVTLIFVVIVVSGCFLQTEPGAS